MVAHLVYESGNDGSSCNMHVIWVNSMGKVVKINTTCHVTQ